jgi:histone H3/H4
MGTRGKTIVMAVSANAVTTLARKAAIRSQNHASFYPETFTQVYEAAEELTRAALCIMRHRGARTIKIEDVKEGARSLGYNIYNGGALSRKQAKRDKEAARKRASAAALAKVGQRDDAAAAAENEDETDNDEGANVDADADVDADVDAGADQFEFDLDE